MSKTVRINGTWTLVPDNWQPGDPAPSSSDNPFARFFDPSHHWLEQPIAGPPIHWAPGPMPYVPFMPNVRMNPIDILRFIAPSMPLPGAPPTLVPQYPTDPNAAGGIPGSGPSGEPLVPFGPDVPVPNVPIPNGPGNFTPMPPPPPDLGQNAFPPQMPGGWGTVPMPPPPNYSPLLPPDVYQVPFSPVQMSAPSYAPWTDIGQLPSSPSGALTTLMEQPWIS